MIDTMSTGSNLHGPFMRNGDIDIYEFRFPIRKEILMDEPADATRFYVKTRKIVENWPEKKLMDELTIVSENLCGAKKCH